MTSVEGRDLSLSCGGYTLRPDQRLRNGGQFRRVFDERLSVADATLVIYGRPRKEPNGRGRLGLSISRKVGNAVVRNRWKRRIREAFRQHPTCVFGWDLVVIPKRAGKCDSQEIAASLPRLADRLKRKHAKRRSSERRRET